MSVGFPWGLLALGAVVPLVAAYFLRRRQKPVQVSALFLWRTPDQRAEAGPRFERFSRELSLLLEILAVIAAALFLADVGCGAAARRTHLVVVVDGSLSMSAIGADGRSVAERTRVEVARAVTTHSADALTIVESGVHPRLLAGPAESPSRALEVLEDWRPRGASHEATPAWVLARELAGPGERILFFTDAVPAEGEATPDVVEVVALGQARPNLAFVSAQRTDEAGSARMSLRVANFGPEPVEVPVTLTAPQSDREPLTQTHTLSLRAGGTALLAVTLAGADVVTARLPEDALPADSVVTLRPSPAAVVPVHQMSGLDSAAAAALTRFIQVDNGAAPSADDSGMTFGPRGSAAQATFGAPGAQRTFVGPFFSDRVHPVLEDVQLGGVVWTAGENPPGRTLVSAGDAVLLSEDEHGTLHFNIELSRSNLHRTVAWPVLMGNVLRRARAQLPGPGRTHLVLGEELPLVVTADAKYALRGPRGDRPILGTGPLTLPAPPEPGTYTLLRDGVAQKSVEVLAIDPPESDLQTRGEGRREATAGAVSARQGTSHERAPWALLVLLALLLLDFALTTGRLKAVTA